MEAVEKVKVQVISLESATVNSAVSKIMRGIRKLDLQVTKAPRWERLNLKTDNMAPYDIYETKAQKKGLVRLRQELAKNNEVSYVPSPINVKDVRMKTLEVHGEHDEIRKIYRISLRKEMDMPGGIILRIPPK